MSIIDSILKYVQQQIEEYRLTSEDNYDFWNEHIKYVYEESLKLASLYKADEEVVALGALLHDIALINKVGDRKDHHINGEIIAKKVLEDFNYDQDKTKRVLKCVYNHRSSKNAESIEETCVSDADVLAHFDNIPMLINSAFERNHVHIKEVKNWLKSVLEKDYDDLSDKTKESFKDRYQEILGKIDTLEFIRLIPYTDEDYNFVYNVKKEAYQKYVKECWGSWIEADQQEYFNKFINHVKDNAYIIMQGSKKIGFYNGEVLENGNYEIGNICIIPEYQNLGIGTKVLKDKLEEYKEYNLEIQYFKQNPVGVLYERLGFIPSGESKFHYQMIKKR
jgi:uncharacterized protein